MRQSAFTLDQAKEQMTHHPTNCVGVTPFSLLYVPSSRNIIILRFACSPQCKFCWIYRLLFDEIDGLSMYQKITCDKWVLSPKGHCQNYSQEVSNLIPKSPSNLAIILCYYFNYTIIPDQKFWENSHCAQCSACHLHILLCTAESRLSLCQLIDRRVEACHALVRSPRPPSGSDLRAVGTGGGHRGGLGDFPLPQFWWPYVKTFYLK